MKASELDQKIARATELDLLVKNSEDELKSLKAELVAEARCRPKELVDTDSGGQKWEYKTKSGEELAISFPAPGIVKEFDVTHPKFAKIREAAGRAFGTLFKAVYKPCKDFRSVAKALLAEDAPDLTGLIEAESAPRCSFTPAPKKCG